MNSSKESVRLEIAPTGQVTQCVLDGIMTLHGAFRTEIADLKKHNTEEFLRVQAAIESVRNDGGASAQTMLEMQKKSLAYAEKNETRCDFVIPGIESLEAKAIKDGESEYVHGKVYLRGYNISPGVQLKKKGECASLGFTLDLHRGDHDEVIQWPFEHKIKFTILHPDKGEEKVIIRKTRRHMDAYKKPTESSDPGVCFSSCFNLGDLKCSGYVCEDTLRVVLEIL